MSLAFDACGATHRAKLSSGQYVTLVCGRFKGHEGWAKKYNPKRHFDGKRSRSWAEKDPVLPYQSPTLRSDERFPHPEWQYRIVERIPYNHPHKNRPACILCGVWECYACPFGFHRDGALRDETQQCPKCGSTTGIIRAIRHIRSHHRPLTVPAPLTLHRVIVVGPGARGRHQISLAPGHWRV